MKEAPMKTPWSLSVIIPVLHEKERINRLIEHLLALPGSRGVEIIVVDGAGKRDTLEAIKCERVITAASSQGRGAQMNAGSRIAAGDILLFLHADTFPPKGVYGLIRRALSDGETAAGAFSFRFDRANPLMKAMQVLHGIRSMVTRIPYGDQAIFIKRSVFEKVGGYREYPLFEEVDLMERLRKGRYRIRILKQKVTSSGRRFHKNGTIPELTRIILLLILYRLKVHPVKLSALYGR
jgi:rSAM/selenodomain-associated transferase 2